MSTLKLMNRTISIHTYNRLWYTQQVIEGLKKNNPELLKEYTLVCSCEPNSEVINYLQNVDISVARKMIYVNETLIGCDNNSFNAINKSFAIGADFNVFLEDDDVPSPDTLDLAEFYVNQDIPDDVLCMCLFTHSEELKDSEIINKNAEFRTWGLVITKKQFEKIIPIWKNYGFGGWDWNLINFQKHNNLTCWQPALSRIKNIGEVGLHYNPGLYEAHRVAKVLTADSKPEKYTLVDNENWDKIY